MSNQEVKTVTDKDGTKRWYFGGELHREDGQAIEYSDGSKAWYRNGRRQLIDSSTSN